MSAITDTIAKWPPVQAPDSPDPLPEPRQWHQFLPDSSSIAVTRPSVRTRSSLPKVARRIEPNSSFPALNDSRGGEVAPSRSAPTSKMREILVMSPG